MTSNQKLRNSQMRQLNLLATLPLALLLAGCATTAGVVKPEVVDNGCSWAKPIIVSGDDVLTDGTAKQILEHDQTGAKVCGWKPNKVKK